MWAVRNTGNDWTKSMGIPFGLRAGWTGWGQWRPVFANRPSSTREWGFLDWDTCLSKVWGLLYTCTGWVWRVKGAEGHVFPALYSDIALSFPNINSKTCACLCQGKSSRISELVNVLEYWRTVGCCSETVSGAWGLKSEVTLDGWNCLRFCVFVERVGMVSTTQGFGGS